MTFFRFAFRQLVKTPGFTFVAIVTLALGIGVSTTAFTTLNRLLLQPLPFRNPERLVQIWATVPQSPQVALTPAAYFDIREGTTAFEELGAYYVNGLASFAEKGAAPERCTTLVSTASFLRVMGIEPMQGRRFADDEQARGERVVMVSHAFWRNKLAGDPQILGRTLRLDGRDATVVGVMSPAFDDPAIFGSPINLWVLDNPEVNRNGREVAWYMAAGRLKPGVALEQAQAELKTLGARLAKEFPKTDGERGLRVIRYPTDSMGEVGGRLTWLIMALSIAVLAIACVNLANLQLIRTTGRSREIAIRLALGSSRAGLIRLMLAESVLLALVGGAAGLLVASWGNAYLGSYLGMDMPLNLRALMFALVASAITGALFGAAPAWIASRADVNRGLKQAARGSTSDRSRHGLRHTLIVVELAVALTLLAAAGFFVNGIYRLAHRDLGWSAPDAVIGMFSFSHEKYGEIGDPRSAAFAERFCQELLNVPGIQHAVISGSSPALGGGSSVKFEPEGQAAPAGREPIATLGTVMPDFFRTYGMRLVQGRDFAATDRKDSPAVAIIGESLARKYWPNENPIGKRLRNTDTNPVEWWEVVGVVKDVGFPFEVAGVERPPQVYRPFAQQSHRFFTITLSGTANARALTDAVRTALARYEPDLAMAFCMTIREFLGAQLQGFSFVRRLLTQIAVLGLLLSAVGIYGVIANLAHERTQEIGIRMALGASPREVHWMFLRTGLKLAGIGTVIGLVGAFGLTTGLSRGLAMVPGGNPLVIAAVAVVVVVIALLACWLPARRATKIDPIIALRSE